ncbi:MAG: hypothetical protein NWP80_01175 [Candidatus Gracilibacteria bacterium]|nr:hypothetical protein [Candidatus Gracilibacteria bacterium]
MKKILLFLTLFFSFFVIGYTFGNSENLNQTCLEKFGETFGDKNGGCPVFKIPCNEVSPCKSGFTCSRNGFCEIDLKKELSQKCGYSQSGIFSKPVCDTCPCKNTFDFDSTLRKCDTIFPVITNNDFSKVFNFGDPFLIK